MPKEEEEYCHRAGRAGRFGRVGTVVSVLTEDELFVLQRCTHTHTHIDVCMHALNHALYSPMSGVNGALVCVRVPAWRGSVRAWHLHAWRAIARGSLSSARAQEKTHRQRCVRS